MRRRLSVATQMMGKAIVAIVLISIVFLLGYGTITEQGMLGSEEHVVTVQWKEHEFYWDSGCWNYYIWSAEGHEYPDL